MLLSLENFFLPYLQMELLILNFWLLISVSSVGTCARLSNSSL